MAKIGRPSKPKTKQRTHAVRAYFTAAEIAEIRRHARGRPLGPWLVEQAMREATK